MLAATVGGGGMLARAPRWWRPAVAAGGPGSKESRKFSIDL